MAGAIISGVGSAVLENPVGAMGAMAAIALPALGTIGALSLIPTLLEQGFERGLFSKMGKKVSGGM
jgi:hypothetical protein